MNPYLEHLEIHNPDDLFKYWAGSSSFGLKWVGFIQISGGIPKEGSSKKI